MTHLYNGAFCRHVNKQTCSVYCQGTFKGSWSHVVRWGKKTCMTMHEMLAFGIEINTCRCVNAYVRVCVRVRALTHVPVICLLACPQTVSEK